LLGGYTITSSSTRLARNRQNSSFLAAEGAVALRTLQTFSP
jgi:hypothetical protein